MGKQGEEWEYRKRGRKKGRVEIWEMMKVYGYGRKKNSGKTIKRRWRAGVQEIINGKCLTMGEGSSPEVSSCHNSQGLQYFNLYTLYTQFKEIKNNLKHYMTKPCLVKSELTDRKLCYKNFQWYFPPNKIIL